MNTVSCPRCHTVTPQLLDVRPELQNFLIVHQSSDGLLKRVCATCMQSFEDATHDFSLIQNRMSATELAKMQLWNGRIDLIKEALSLMKSSSYTEAQAKYEEYLKNIEQVLGVPTASITAQSFANAGKSDELAVYCLVLWDLIICNDGKNEVAQQEAANKMIELVKGTALRKTLKDRARQYQKKAKNKKFFKKLQKEDFRKDRGCYVASYAYGNYDHPRVLILREFRDQKLEKYFIGRLFIKAYYLLSPYLVKILTPIPYSKELSKKTIDWMVETFFL